LVLASLILAACGGQAKKSEGEVAIVAWPGYIERGANDPAYDWVTKFEQEATLEILKTNLSS
jgi:putative spermidine/putrescine transport system substrate-binding protein